VKTIKIDLSPRENDIISEALDTYTTEQLPSEGDPLRLANVERFAEAFPHANGRYTKNQVHELAEACDAHLYWAVSDERDRNDGFVYYENDPAIPNSKMDRDDRDPAYVERCREVDDLARKLEAHTLRA
jgi:hypothetical protein